MLLAAGGVAVGLVLGAAGCGGSDPDEPVLGPVEGVLAAGHVADYPVGTVRRIDEGPVFVIRDAGGLYAMSAVCTHLGCTVNPATDRLSCPCHGSEFDFDGGVRQGPATDPLRHYAVFVAADGSVTVDTTTAVDPAERTAA